MRIQLISFSARWRFWEQVEQIQSKTKDLMAESVPKDLRSTISHIQGQRR